MKPFLILTVIALGGCAGLTRYDVGMTADGALHPCPPAPRCVRSADPVAERRVAPLDLVDGGDTAWQAVIEVLRGWPRTTLVRSGPEYLHAEVLSPWRVYTDDVELLRRPGHHRVQVRSSARIGYYDFNVNRARVEALRQALDEAGLLGHGAGR